MKRGIAMMLVLTLAAGASFSQTEAATPIPSQISVREDPQFAYRILDTYISGRAQADRMGGTVLISMGGTLIAAGLGGAFYSFLFPSQFTETFGEENLVPFQIGSCVVGVSGFALAGFGLPIAGRKEEYYRNKYSLVYSEGDPVVREAMAYGSLRDLAAEAKRNRVYGGVVAASTPVINVLLNGIIGSVGGKTDAWSQSIDNIGFMSWFNLATGLATIFFTKSSEERLLDTYVSMSAAYAGNIR